MKLFIEPHGLRGANAPTDTPPKRRSGSRVRAERSSTRTHIALHNEGGLPRRAISKLSELVKQLRPGGRVIVVEYDRRAASQWVPYPIPASRWLQLAESAGLMEPTITATRPSSYSGILYTGAATRPLW